MAASKKTTPTKVKEPMSLINDNGKIKKLTFTTILDY